MKREKDLQEEIILSTIKEWINNPIKIDLEEKIDIKTLQGFKSKSEIEEIFYRDFDALVDCINKHCKGYYHIRVDNISVEVIDGSKPIDEDDE